MTGHQKLVEIVQALRGPNGCPWDKAQTFQSLTPYIIEEAYELVDAIERHDREAIREELGDLLLHVVMMGLMAQEQSWFTLDDIASGVAEKMVRRHPHVFGNTKVGSVDDVWTNWEQIKKTEKEGSVLASIPRHFPALLQAEKIQKRVSRLGFDWAPADIRGPAEKVTEELAELAAAANQNDSSQAEIEMGDVLFAAVNLGRKLNINAEESLRKSNQKFMRRFEWMEAEAMRQNQDLAALSPAAWETLWTHAKGAVG
ncbi:MAG: nucleoside triphosphate pyrophosphohydrolase [Candidatus Margulisiibacteriota bacterium]